MEYSMREIKFRAWVVDEYDIDGDTPTTFKMVGWNAQFFSDMSPVTRWSSEFPDPNDGEVFLMQYTGLQDKNGKEIYEGDVVSDHIGVGAVEYVERYAAFRVNYQDGRAKWFFDFNLKGERESIEVIGNIYETPEMLEHGIATNG